MKIKNLIFTGTSIFVLILWEIFTMKKYSKTKNSLHQYKIIFLHHSTGEVIINGGNKPIRFIGRFSKQQSSVSKWVEKYNKTNKTNFYFDEQFFPKRESYGWHNYPYDYYNIWVKHAGVQPYMNEPTLEILTKQYNLIIFKHCFPVCDLKEDKNRPDINSSEKTLENYKFQYLALKQKLHEFPNTKFLIWTGAAQVESNTTKEQALKSKEFFAWVKKEWDTPNDNIYIWDFYDLETEGGLYLKPEFARNPNDSHPSQSFAKRILPQFCYRIIEVIQHNN
jgi:hypothetical protein